MKTLFLLLLLPTLSFGRTRHYSDEQMLNYLRWGASFELGYDYSQQLYYGSKPKVIKLNKVETVTSYNVNKHGKKKWWYERSFDSSGRLVRMKSKENEVKFKFTDTLLTEIHRTSKKDEFNTKIAYDAQSRIVKITFFKNDKVIEETNYNYFSDKKTSLVEKKIYDKKVKTYRLETDYDELLKTASESRYTINGKLKKRWTYSCDEKGKLEEKKVEEITQCNYSATNNDGSYINYTRTIENGKDYLQEATFSRDSVLMESKRFLHDSILVNHSTYSKTKEVFEAFNKHGKRSYKSVIEKDTNGNTVRNAYYSRKAKLISDVFYSYSATDLVQEVTYSSGRKVQFEYTYL